VLVGGGIIPNLLTPGQFGTFTAQISLGPLRPPKHDGLLFRTGFRGKRITNFHFEPSYSASIKLNVFFLERQAIFELGLLCMTTLEDLLEVYPEHQSTSGLLNYMQNIGRGKLIVLC